MKNTRSLIVVLALAAAVIVSCKKESKTETEATTEESAASTTTSSAAVVTKLDSTRKFIRTADLKFKAKDVAKTTYAIENITTKLGGFVAYTNLQSTTNEEQTNKLNADSSVVTKHFTVENEMVLRVPNTRLDSTLKAITPLIGHLDFRVIKANDVSLTMLSNKMAQSRSAESSKRLANAIDGKGKKLNDIANAEDKLTTKKEQSDNAKLENLSLKDQVSFSTVNIAMYQNEAVSHEMIANDDSGKYDQGLGSRFMDSLKTGWNMVTALLVFFTQLWGLLLIVLIAFIGYRKYKLSFKK
ncbi:MAG TPA: DUF4349 domain-containing protein [Flavobacterium sp.]|nr:DUF4349 domain-containing protein [Flavobacterium sp.]